MFATLKRFIGIVAWIIAEPDWESVVVICQTCEIRIDRCVCDESGRIAA